MRNVKEEAVSYSLESLRKKFDLHASDRPWIVYGLMQTSDRRRRPPILKIMPTYE